MVMEPPQSVVMRNVSVPPTTLRLEREPKLRGGAECSGGCPPKENALKAINALDNEGIFRRIPAESLPGPVGGEKLRL